MHNQQKRANVEQHLQNRAEGYAKQSEPRHMRGRTKRIAQTGSRTSRTMQNQQNRAIVKQNQHNRAECYAKPAESHQM